MKILINRKIVEGPWGGGNNFVKAFYKYMPLLGYEIVESLNQGPDIIFIMDPRYDKNCISINEAIKYKTVNPACKIIQRINECDARKGTNDIDKLLINCSNYIDKTIFVSNWMKNYFLEKGWHCKDNNVLINGVDDNYGKKKKYQMER